MRENLWEQLDEITLELKSEELILKIVANSY